MEILGFNIGRSSKKQHDIARDTFQKSINYIGTNLQFNKYQFKDYSSPQLIRQGYMVCSAVSSIITRYQVAYPEPFMKTPTVGDKEITDKLLLNALQHPNEWMSQSDLMRYIITYKLWTGNSYVVKDRNAYGQVIGFFPFSDLNIVPIATKENFVSHYDFFDITGQQIGQYAREDVIQLSWFAPDPYAPWKGIAPMKLVAREIDTDVEFTKFLAAFISNDATPGFILKVMKDALANTAGVSKGSATKMIAAWRERFSGSGRGNPVILEPGFEAQSVGSPLKDLDLTNSRAVPEARICAELLIPPEVVGLNVGMAHSTENNLAAAEIRWTDRTLIPMWVQDADSWTMGLQYDVEGVKCEYDIDKVASVKQQRATQRIQLATPLREYVQAYNTGGFPSRESAIASAKLVFSLNDKEVEEIFPVITPKQPTQTLEVIE